MIETKKYPPALPAGRLTVADTPRSESAARMLRYTEDMLITALHDQLNELLTTIGAREPGERFPTPKEMSIQDKLIRCIQDLKKPIRRRNFKLKHWHQVVNSILNPSEEK